MFKIMATIAVILAGAATSVAAAELRVYAGAGLKEPVDVVAQEFRRQTGATVTIEYGGSGQLLARIKETGAGDVFIPGSMMFIDKLEQDGQVVSRYPLAIHGAVVAVNKAAGNRIKSFSDLAKPGIRIGLGDAKAMALGRTAEEILERSPEKQAILANVVVRAATVKQLALYVINGDVDAAIVGGPEVAANPDTLMAVAIPDGLYQPEIAGVAVLKTSSQPELAEAFAALLSSDTGRAAFTAAGFPPAKP